MVATKKPGIVLQRPDLLIADTRELAWEEFPGLAGFRIKVLSRYPTGEPSVFVLWQPPGEVIPDLPHRHVHRRVREHALVLEGEFPHWEYEGPEQQHGDCIVLRRGFYMDRRPGSLHGLEEAPVSETGFLVLFWREGGTGSFLDEPNAAEETITVPYDPGRRPAERVRFLEPGPDGVIVDRPDLTMLDTRALAWQDFPGLAGCKVKPLSRFADGEPSVYLVHMPAGSPVPPESLPHRHLHPNVTERSFVLSGELPHWEYASAAEREGELVVFRQGFYMDRRPGSIHGLEPGPVSPTGALILFWRDGTGNWLDEPNAAEESPEVPYPA